MGLTVWVGWRGGWLAREVPYAAHPKDEGNEGVELQVLHPHCALERRALLAKLERLLIEILCLINQQLNLLAALEHPADALGDEHGRGEVGGASGLSGAGWGRPGKRGGRGRQLGGWDAMGWDANGHLSMFSTMTCLTSSISPCTRPTRSMFGSLSRENASICVASAKNGLAPHASKGAKHKEMRVRPIRMPEAAGHWHMSLPGVRGHMRPHVATRGHTWPHVATHSHTWPHMATHGHT